MILDGFVFILQPEMEMVARGLAKHLKLNQRQFLMSMLVGICSEESQRRVAEALGLVRIISSLQIHLILCKYHDESLILISYEKLFLKC